MTTTLDAPTARPVFPGMIDDSEQSDLFNPALFGYQITVIGCGGIGSTFAPVLATLGAPKIRFLDADSVDPRNVRSTLLFGPRNVTHPKVDVVAAEMERLGVPDYEVFQEMFDPEKHRDLLGDPLNMGIVVTGLDHMDQRRMVWEQAIKDNPFVALLLDGRTGGETWQLNTVNPNSERDVNWYEKFQLFDQSQAAQLPCTARNVVYAAINLAGTMARTIARFSRGEPVERMVSQNMATLGMTTIP